MATRVFELTRGETENDVTESTGTSITEDVAIIIKWANIPNRDVALQMIENIKHKIMVADTTAS